MIFVVTSIFATGWIFLGPVIILIIVPFFLSKGRSENVDLKVPLLSTAIVLSLVLGFFTTKALQSWLSVSDVLEVVKPIAAARIIPSVVSSGVLIGRESATIQFAMEQVGGLFALLYGVLVYRNPSILYKVVDDIFDRTENLPNNSPWKFAILSFLLLILFLFSFYFFSDVSYLSRRSAFVLPMLPHLLFSCSYVCVFFVLRYVIKTKPSKN